VKPEVSSVHCSEKHVTGLSRMNPVNIFYILFKIHFDILPSTLLSTKRSLPFSFSHQNLAFISLMHAKCSSLIELTDLVYWCLNLELYSVLFFPLRVRISVTGQCLFAGISSIASCWMSWCSCMHSSSWQQMELAYILAFPPGRNCVTHGLVVVNVVSKHAVRHGWIHTTADKSVARPTDPIPSTNHV
jgi:hypothetical protein